MDKQSLKIISILLVGLSWGACKGEVKPGVPVTFQQACQMDGKTVDVEGFVRFAQHMECRSSNCSVNLYPTDQVTYEIPYRILTMPVGGGKNKMELPPQKFTSTDLKIHDRNGQLVGYNNKVRITGYVLGNKTGQDWCQISVEAIQKL